MADLVLIASAVYFIFAAGFLIYRVQGVLSRRIAMHIANNVLRKFDLTDDQTIEGSPVRRMATAILSDRHVASAEFEKFPEVLAAYYISKRQLAVRELEVAVKNKDNDFRTLMFLAKRSLDQTGQVNLIINHIIEDGKSGSFSYFSSQFARHRISRYLTEYVNLIEKDFSRPPRKKSVEVDIDLGKRLGLRAQSKDPASI